MSIVGDSHRTAAAIALRLPLPVVRVRTAFGPEEPGWSAMGWERLSESGLDRQYSAAMALEYLRRNADSTLFVFWPAARQTLPDFEVDAIKTLHEAGAVVYRGQVTVDTRSDAPILLVLSAYLGAQWLGSGRDKYAGAYKKASRCFPASADPIQAIDIVVWQATSTACQARDTKLRLRQQFAGKLRDVNAAVHCSDDATDALALGHLLLSPSGRWFTAHAAIRNVPDWLELTLSVANKVKRWAANREVPLEALCVTSGSVLQALGVRKAGDTDLIVVDALAPNARELMATDTAGWDIECHNKHFPQAADIVTNPFRHFVFLGVKFLAFSDLKFQKKDMEVAATGYVPGFFRCQEHQLDCTES